MIYKNVEMIWFFGTGKDGTGGKGILRGHRGLKKMYENCSYLITTKESQAGGTGEVLDQEDGGADNGEGDHVEQEGHGQCHLSHAHKHVEVKGLG